MLDDKHKRKIDMTDKNFAINIVDYIGESTRNKIAYKVSRNWREIPGAGISS